MKPRRAALRRVEAVERLVGLMRQEEPPAAACAAACAILDLALGTGRVKRNLETDGNGKRRLRYDFSGLTTAEKLDLEAALSAALEGRGEA